MKSPLRLVPLKPNQAVVEILEYLLAEAQRGELQSLYYVCETQDSNTGSGWLCRNDGASKARVIGELELLKAKMVEIECRVIGYDEE